MTSTTRGLKLSTRYQGRDMVQTIAWYFGIMSVVMIAMMLISNLMANRGIQMYQNSGSLITVEGSWDGSTFWFGGIEETSYLVFFILGLNMFRENLWMLLQNGISRKSKFLGHLITVLWGSLAATVINLLLTIILKNFSAYLNSKLLAAGFGRNGTVDGPLNVSTSVEMIHGLEWNGTTMIIFLLTVFTGLILAASIGYFLTIMYYRLSTFGKAIVSVGVPVFFLIVLPMLDFRLFNGRFTASITSFMAKVTTPWGTPPVSLFFAMIFILAAWLIMRRAPVKRVGTA